MSHSPSRPPIRRTLVWRGIELVVVEYPDSFWRGSTRLEVIVEHPRHAALPITDTGTQVLVVDSEKLSLEGGPVIYLIACLDRAAQSKSWRERELRARQLTLFRDLR